MDETVFQGVSHGLNRAYLIGTIGNEPEPKTAASGTTVLKLTLKTPGIRVARDSAGKEVQVDAPDWHRLTFFGKQAEFVSKNSHKGDTLGVECALKPGRWLDREGTVHYTLDLVVERILLLHGPPPPLPHLEQETG